MAWLRFFCSTSSLFVLMQIPIVRVGRCGSRPQEGWKPLAEKDGGALGPARRSRAEMQRVESVARQAFH